MTKLLITRKLPDDVVDAAIDLFEEVEVRDSTIPLTPVDATAAMTIFDAILPTLGDGFTKEAFDAAGHRCKILANFGVGYNHIDVDAATKAGIAVTNTPGAVTDATADIAMTLMLMTCRRAGEGERLVRASKWDGWHPTQLLGCHVSGKTVGIVGMGRIGQAIARRCRLGFGMTVKYFNRSSKPIEGCTQVASLDELMGGVDVVVVAVPGGAETRHIIDSAVLSAMRKDAFLVNIARGDVIDESALVAVLEAGLIAGAGLDVYEHEPKVPDSLKEMENVTLLPHLGTAALEVRTSMGMMAIANLAAWLDGKPLPNQV